MAAEQDYEQAQRILPILLRKKQEGSDPANVRKKKFQNQKSVKQLRAAVEEKYSYRDLQGVDWDARFAEFESRLVDTQTSRQFAILAGQLLRWTPFSIRMVKPSPAFGEAEAFVPTWTLIK
ncbi:MAG: hypothetical protein J4F29_25620 [Candidatus Latescibacteria bacterium]|nr:hypothetical protein [Candidatus Latescibacterota bacterium]